MELVPIEVGGYRGCFTQGGLGRVVVLLVSPFARAVVYRPTVDALSARFRVIVVEMPGCGCGSRLRPGWGFDEYAKWVAEFLGAMGLDDVILIGHSSSAATALLAAARHRARIAALVLADPVGARGPRSLLAVLAGCVICVPLELRFAFRLAPRAALNLWRHARNFLKQFWLSVQADLRADAPKVAVPTLVAWGSWDFVMPVSGAAALLRLLPGGKAHVARHRSHDWLIEHPAEFAEAIEEFVVSAVKRQAVTRDV